MMGVHAKAEITREDLLGMMAGGKELINLERELAAIGAAATVATPA